MNDDQERQPLVYSFSTFQKRFGPIVNFVYIKNPDTHFFFSLIDFEENPDFPYWYEDDGNVYFRQRLFFKRKDYPLIHERMGVWLNFRPFRMRVATYLNSFDRDEPVEMLWLKVTGKTDRKYDNEYKYLMLDKVRCYKIARFLRASNYKFSPELNDYLHLRCGMKFDLELMDVEVLAFNDTKGQVYPAQKENEAIDEA